MQFVDAYTMVRENLNFVQHISLTKNRYEVTSNKFTRDLSKELLVSLVASVFMGFGVVFLLLWGVIVI
jgi:formate/nitrite transporter FocA (FNT family)